MMTGNYWRDSSVKDKFERAQQLLEKDASKSDSQQVAADTNKKTNLQNAAGGVPTPAVAVGLKPAGNPAELAVSASSWQASILGESVRIRQAVEALGGQSHTF